MGVLMLFPQRSPPLCSSLQQSCFPSERERKRFFLEVQMDLTAFLPQLWNCAKRKGYFQHIREE